MKILISPNPINNDSYLFKKYKLSTMKNKKHQEIIDILINYLSKENSEHIRFTQALFTLGINNFENPDNPEKNNYLFQYNYNISDEKILKIIKEKINVNEGC